MTSWANWKGFNASGVGIPKIVHSSPRNGHQETWILAWNISFKRWATFIITSHKNLLQFIVHIFTKMPIHFDFAAKYWKEHQIVKSIMVAKKWQTRQMVKETPPSSNRALNYTRLSPHQIWTPDRFYLIGVDAMSIGAKNLPQILIKSPILHPLHADKSRTWKRH